MSRIVDEKRNEIVRELPVDFVRKMQNWVKSRNGSGFAMTSAYDDVKDSSGYAISVPPTLVGEASDVDEALAKVPNREALAVQLFWEMDGASLRQIGRRLLIDYHTVESRVRKGHTLLRAELDATRQARFRMHQQIAATGAGA